MRRSIAERFWAKVDRREGDDCWPWKASRSPKGYGWFHAPPEGVRRDMVQAHRVAWELACGPIPPGLWVLHRCDNPSCVRADHLFLGTNADNVADKMAKGRHSVPAGDQHFSRRQPERLARGDRHGFRLHPERVLRGERVAGAKLIAVEVRAIRFAICYQGQTFATAGRAFGVGPNAARNAYFGITWAHESYLLPKTLRERKTKTTRARLSRTG